MDHFFEPPDLLADKATLLSEVTLVTAQRVYLRRGEAKLLELKDRSNLVDGVYRVFAVTGLSPERQ
ncbi:MAG: hypothetical protein WBQ66_05545 [Blastocatellia bacterium]